MNYNEENNSNDGESQYKDWEEKKDVLRPRGGVIRGRGPFGYSKVVFDQMQRWAYPLSSSVSHTALDPFSEVGDLWTDIDFHSLTNEDRQFILSFDESFSERSHPLYWKCFYCPMNDQVRMRLLPLVTGEKVDRVRMNVRTPFIRKEVPECTLLPPLPDLELTSNASWKAQHHYFELSDIRDVNMSYCNPEIHGDSIESEEALEFDDGLQLIENRPLQPVELACPCGPCTTYGDTDLPSPQEEPEMDHSLLPAPPVLEILKVTSPRLYVNYDLYSIDSLMAQWGRAQIHYGRLPPILRDCEEVRSERDIWTTIRNVMCPCSFTAVRAFILDAKSRGYSNQLENYYTDALSWNHGERVLEYFQDRRVAVLVSKQLYFKRDMSRLRQISSKVVLDSTLQVDDYSDRWLTEVLCSMQGLPTDIVFIMHEVLKLFSSYSAPIHSRLDTPGHIFSPPFPFTFDKHLAKTGVFSSAGVAGVWERCNPINHVQHFYYNIVVNRGDQFWLDSPSTDFQYHLTLITGGGGCRLFDDLYPQFDEYQDVYRLIILEHSIGSSFRIVVERDEFLFPREGAWYPLEW